MMILAAGLILTTLAVAGGITLIARVVRKDGAGGRVAWPEPPRSHPRGMFEPRPWI